MEKQKRKRKKKVVKFNSPISINIGIVVFGLILIYILINAVIYFTTEKTKYYEVVTGSNAKGINTSYVGIAMRNEIIEYANQTGYVDYFIREGSRVSKNSTLYSIDSTGNLNQLLSKAGEDYSNMTDENMQTISNLLYDYSNNYDDMDFSDVYDFKSTLKGSIVDLLNMNSLQRLAKKNGGNFAIEKSAATGIVLYRVDDFETLTSKKLKASMFDKSLYNSALFSSGDKIEKGAPVYKTINSDEWSIAVQLTKKTAREYKKEAKERKSDYANIKIKFLKDGLNTTANIKVVRGTDKKYYGVITLSKYVVRYATDRYIDIEIVNTPKNGYKVPKSSIVSNDLYVIPAKYSTKGKNDNNVGFNVQSSDRNKGESKIYYPPIAYADDENYYVSRLYFNDGEVITKPDSHETYVIGHTRKFMGAYNINNGYTVFTVVSILDSTDEYNIIKIMDYSLKIYDRIVLDASKVTENQVIYQ